MKWTAWVGLLSILLLGAWPMEVRAEEALVGPPELAAPVVEEPLFLTTQAQCLASCARDYNACVAGCGGSSACTDACFEADLTCQVQRCHFNS